MEEKERKKIILTALKEASKAFHQEEVPVGAVIFNTKTGQILSKAHNLVEKQKNPLAHAEMLALKKALSKVEDKFLSGYSIFVTLEPCTMCAGAIAWARLDALYYGAQDAKTGAIEQGTKVFTHPQTHHKIKTQLWPNLECGALMTQFFKRKRK